MLDESVHQQVYEALAKYDSHGLLVYENHDLSSSLIGHRFAIGWGPNNTIKEVTTVVKCTVIPPQGYAWQYMLAAYSDDLSSHDEENHNE